MSARDNILARIRARQGKPEVPTEDERAAVDSYIAARASHARPRVDGDLRGRFRDRVVELKSTYAEVAAMEDVPRAVADYLRGVPLAASAVCWPGLASLDWKSAGIDVAARAARGDDTVGITGAFCAIAETGTLLLLSGPDTPSTASLVPETHIAVVRADRIVAGMEDAWALVRSERGAPPRASNFVSGPSRTADIEQTVTLGAHGPSRVHVVVVTG